jgi:hypothetical protein
MQHLLQLILLGSGLAAVGIFFGGCCCNCGWTAAFTSGVDGSAPPPADFTATTLGTSQQAPDWGLWQPPTGSGYPLSWLRTTEGYGTFWKTSKPASPSWEESAMCAHGSVWGGKPIPTEEGNVDQNQCGIFIAGARVLYLDFNNGNLYQAPCDANGVPGAPVLLKSAAIGASFNTLEIAVVGEGKGSGTFTIHYLLGGAEIPGTKEAGVTLSVDPTLPVKAGLWTTGAAAFGSASLVCGIDFISCCSGAGVPGTLCGRLINWTGHLSCSDTTFTLTYQNTPPSFASTLPGWLGTVPTIGSISGFQVFMDLKCNLWYSGPQTWMCAGGSSSGSPLSAPTNGGGDCGSVCTPYFSRGFDFQAATHQGSSSFFLVVADPASGRCTRNPDWLALGKANDLGNADPVLPCEAPVSPITVTLSSTNCTTFNGVTFPVALTSFNDGGADWQATFEAGGQTWKFSLSYFPQLFVFGGTAWYASICSANQFCSGLASSQPSNSPYGITLTSTNSAVTGLTQCLPCPSDASLGCPTFGGTATQITAMLTP